MRTIALFIFLVVSNCLLVGCYTRVVGTKGVTSEAHDVHQPNMPSKSTERNPAEIESRTYSK